jgi:N-acetylmuramoyl-L-alanine amidase
MKRKILMGIVLPGIFYLVMAAVAQTNPNGVSNSSSAILYVVGGQGYPLQRVAPSNITTLEEKLQWTMEAFIKGPSAEEAKAGAKTPIPAGTTLLKTVIDKKVLTAYLALPNGNKTKLSVVQVDEIYDSLGKTFYSISSGYSINLVAWDETSKTYKTLSDFLPALPPLQKKPENQCIPEPVPAGKGDTTSMIQELPIGGQGQPSGFLTGKTVFLSAGHGWYYSSGSGTSSVWYTQRGNYNGIVEDLSNVESVNEYLQKYLWNAGANVWTCRGRSRDAAAFYVDNGGTGYSSSGAWSTSTSASTWYGSNYAVVAAASVANATAIFRPTISVSGTYPVYVFYTGGSNRATDVHYLIVHSGGTTETIINQQRDGYTWKWLGNYYFEAGTNGCVIVTNQSSSPSGKYIIADALCVGDGKGSIYRGGVTSGKSKQDECSRYWAQYMGAPTSVYATAGADNDDDVTCRPRYAEWERESWEDACYISWHSNGSDGTGSGTSSYIWSTTYGWGQPTPVNDGPATSGSYDLLTSVHYEIVNDIRKGYDSSWTNGGIMRNNYGELRPLENMPGALFEMAYHDNATKDSLYLRDPQFRRIVARAVYQGIVKYYAKKAGTTAVFLPEPPTDLTVANTGSGTVLLTWKAPTTDSVGLGGHAATGYKVYRSQNGYGFDNGTVTVTTSLTVSGLTPGSVYYFRVSATNAGGESFPTETLAVRVKSSGKANILIVNGFDRMDRSLMPAVTEKSTYYGSNLGTPYRMFFERINTYNYAIQHGKAIAASASGPYYFDSASNEAVIDNRINLTDYAVVVWIMGNESTADETFSSAEQTKVASYLEAGKSLFVSGAEIGWDLGRTAGSSDSTFYANYLKAKYYDDDAETYNVAAGSGIFNGMSAFSFDNGSNGSYDVAYPDQITANGGSTADLSYSGGSGGTAGIQYSGSYKLVYLAFPFESITSESVRTDLMNRALQYLGATDIADWSLF